MCALLSACPWCAHQQNSSAPGLVSCYNNTASQAGSLFPPSRLHSVWAAAETTFLLSVGSLQMGKPSSSGGNVRHSCRKSPFVFQNLQECFQGRVWSRAWRTGIHGPLVHLLHRGCPHPTPSSLHPHALQGACPFRAWSVTLCNSSGLDWNRELVHGRGRWPRGPYHNVILWVPALLPLMKTPCTSAKWALRWCELSPHTHLTATAGVCAGVATVVQKSLCT